MKAKPTLTAFGGTSVTLRLDEISFLKYLVGFKPYWHYKPTNSIHADAPGFYTSDSILNLSTIDKFLLKCDCFNGSFINGVQQPVLYCFVLKKPAGFKAFVNLRQYTLKK